MARIRVGKMEIFSSAVSGQSIRVSECYHVFAVFFVSLYHANALCAKQEKPNQEK